MILRSLTFGLFLLPLAAACDGPKEAVDPVPGEGGAGGGSSSGGGGAGGDATGGGGSGIACEPGANLNKVIGPEGGKLVLCGAELVVPEGAVAKDVAFTIGLVPPEAEAPFEHVFSGGVFAFSASVEKFDLPLGIAVPHEDVDARFELVRFDVQEDAFFGLEACEVTANTIGQDVFVLGTYAAVRDINDYPDSTSGLGDGTLDATFLEEPVAYDVDDAGSYAIFSNQPGGGRLVTLSLLRSVGEGVESLKIDFQLDATGTSGALVQIQWVSTVTSTGYSFIEGLIGSDGAITVATDDDGRLSGDVSATLSGGDPAGEEAFAAAFGVLPEKYSFPPELSCFGQGGG